MNLKKYASSTAYYIQIPTLGSKITQIVATVSGTSQTMTGGSNSATLYFSSSSSTSAAGTGVVSGTGASSITIDASSLNLNTGYLTANAAIRIWGITVTYSTEGSSEGGGGSEGGSDPDDDLTALSVPSNLSISNIGKTVADLSWDAVENASSYTVKIGTREVTDINTNSYHVTGLYAGVTYKWSVKAVGDGTTYSDGEFAEEKEFTTTPHTITWSVNGQTTTSQYKNNADIVFNTPSSNIPEDKVFVGWTSSLLEGTTNTAPNFVTSKKATTNEMFYAVFATATGEGISWKKVTNLAAMETGTYALISDNGFAFNGTFSEGNNSHGQQTETAFNFDDNGVASSAPDGTCELTITATENATSNRYTIYSEAHDKYLYISSTTSGNLKFKSGPESNYWDFSKNSNQDEGTEQFRYHYSNTAQLRYYNTSFRNYGTSTNNGEVVSFAKKVGNVSYSDFCTTVATSEEITISPALYSTYYNSKKAYTMPTGLTGYIFNASTKKIESAYAAGSVVPAGEALVLGGSANNYTLNFTTTTATKNANNALLGTDVAATTTVINGDAADYYFYGLSLDENDANVGFYWMEANGVAFTNGAHKAYLALAKNSTNNAPRRFLFETTDTATAVENVETAEVVKFFENGQLLIQKNGRVYNAMGQLVR